MTAFDWNATIDRPLSLETVWTLMQAGCNAAEIAAAGGVGMAAAIGLMREAVPHAAPRGVLHLPEAA